MASVQQEQTADEVTTRAKQLLRTYWAMPILERLELRGRLVPFERLVVDLLVLVERLSICSPRLTELVTVAERVYADIVATGEQHFLVGLSLRELERLAIIAALTRWRGSQVLAATELGVSRRMLHYKIHVVHHIGVDTYKAIVPVPAVEIRGCA